MSRAARYDIASEACEERDRQDAKWGVQEHPIIARTPPARRRHYQRLAETWKEGNAGLIARQNAKGIPSDRNCDWEGIMLEEVYEALAETDYEKARAEWIQVIAVGMAIVEFLDRNHG